MFIFICGLERTSLVAQTVKNLPAMWETKIPSLGKEGPWRRKQQPLPGESHGQRSLAGYIPWGPQSLNNNNTYLYLHLRKSTLKCFKLTSRVWGRASGSKESEGTIRKWLIHGKRKLRVVRMSRGCGQAGFVGVSGKESGRHSCLASALFSMK